MTCRVCEVCSHPFAHRHRLVPGTFGGTYRDPKNIAHLCPNCHAAMHFLMDWLGGGKTDTEINAMPRKHRARFQHYVLGDMRIFSFFQNRVLPICQAMRSLIRQVVQEVHTGGMA